MTHARGQRSLSLSWRPLRVMMHAHSQRNLRVSPRLLYVMTHAQIPEESESALKVSWSMTKCERRLRLSRRPLPVMKHAQKQGCLRVRRQTTFACHDACPKIRDVWGWADNLRAVTHAQRTEEPGDEQTNLCVSWRMPRGQESLRMCPILLSRSQEPSQFEKNLRPDRDSNLEPFAFWANALPTEVPGRWHIFY